MSTTDPRTVTCRISAGELAGTAADGVARYLGVPYAAAPFGPRRFAAPEPVTPWHGTRDATDYGATAPQAPYPGALNALLPTVTIPGEDILHVNLWAPQDRADGGWPVLVWFHGGSFTHGANAMRLYDGTAFARRGLVVVSVNYRLGAEGFSVLDGAPANLGLADQAAALRWVHEEIAAFGGNPGQVTVVGESAGGNTVAALMTSPRAKGMLHRAVVQSGPLVAVPLDQAGKVTNRMAKHLGIATTRDAFARVPPAALLAAQEKVTAGSTLFSGAVGFAIALDGDLVPQTPADAFHAGVADEVPLLTGTTTEEYRLWFVPNGTVDRVNRLYLMLARLKYRLPASVVRTYRRGLPQATPGEVLGALATDLLLRVPMMAAADSRADRAATTWVYEYAWPSPVARLRAAHSTEIPFVFDTLHTTDARALVGADAPTRLAATMNQAWALFARGENPGWPAWDATRPVRRFDTGGDDVVHAPREAERAALQAALEASARRRRKR